MVERSNAEAAIAMHGVLVAGDPAARWSGAAIDSRRLRGQEIFFALSGTQADGHDFVPQAIAGGAATVVIARDLAPETLAGAGVIRVEDTFQALHDLTRAVRREVPRHLVAITGSAGKTTTKELLATLLGRRFQVAKSPGNLNNLYGFPLSLLGLPETCEWMVAEMGMSTPGELRQLSLLGRPDVVLLINVRPVHLVNFADLRGIAEAKAELLTGLAEDGLVVANADDPEVMRVARRHVAAHPGTQLVRYGLVEPAEVRATALEPAPAGQIGSRFELVAGGETVAVELPIHGLYNVENCLAAAATALALGVSLPEIAAAVTGFTPAYMRGAVHQLASGILLIDDAYNSNPDAAQKALASAAHLPGERHVAILGDMLELGPREPEYHREVGAAAAALGFSPVVGVGELARELVAAAIAGGAEAVWVENAQAAAAWVTTGCRRGDVVLVKGSRGIGLEAVVAALRRDEEAA